MEQQGIQDSGFAMMIELQRRVSEVLSPSGRRNGRLKQFGQSSYLATEAESLQERARIAAERQERIQLGRSFQSPTGNRRTCNRLAEAGVYKTALRRTDQMDWNEAQSLKLPFVVRIELGGLSVNVFRAWRGPRGVTILESTQGREAYQVIREGRADQLKAICYNE
jgi:hypothetical protein